MKDTEQFVDKIGNIKLEEGKTMVSFDISDIYPSLPRQDVITAAKFSSHIKVQQMIPYHLVLYMYCQRKHAK